MKLNVSLRRHWSRELLLIAAAFLLMAAPAAAAQSVVAEPTPDESEASYIIGPENMLQIKIFGQTGINQIYRVDEQGFIRHVLVGPVRLGGLNVMEAEKVLEGKLSGDYIINPNVSVFVLEHSRFSILGEVRRPGSYEILGRVSVIEALSMAGGFTPVASQKDIKIRRKTEAGEEILNYDATRVTSGDSRGDLFIEADDVIVVGKSFF